MSRRRSEDAGPAERDDDEQSIIDVFEFDDTAHDRWLCSMSRRSSAEAKVEDLDAWLHADVPEAEVAQADNGSRRSIDTRTFTRIKRRSNRLSFDALEGFDASELRPYSLSNVWKNQAISESSPLNNNNNNDKERSVMKDNRRDSIPMMLRPKTNQVLAALLSESPSSINSQASMEAFRNMATSKEGISSLLSDMSDPDVSNFLMNISQPSLLYSSIISDGRGVENTQGAGMDSLIDSQILTDSMMEASMFKEVQDTTMLAEFLKQNNDSTVIEDATFCKSLSALEANDKTFTNEQFSDKTYINIDDKIFKNSNETFVTAPSAKINDTYTSQSPTNNDANSTKIISSQENLFNSTHVISNTPGALNSTKTISTNHNASVQNADILSTTQTISNDPKTDLTFDLKTALPSSREALDSTFQTSDFSAGQVLPLNASTGEPLDVTFCAVPNLRAELLQEVRRSSGKFDSTFTSAQLPNIETKLDVTYERPNTIESLACVETLDATYVQVPSLHQSESQTAKKCLDVTYDSTQSNAAGARRMSYLKKNPAESQMQLPEQNRFSTFKKESKIGGRLSKVPQTQETQAPVIQPLQQHVPVTKVNDGLYQQRFNTFKKTNSMKNNTFTRSDSDENQRESKFSKPPEKLTRQIQAPRQLSKLPQFFQKSNPNLGTSLKPFGKMILESEATFIKGSQPNIAGNAQPLGRFRSEQRLLQAKPGGEFTMGEGTSRSMESIDSTASVHSAPDLDDRFSVCSDSSRASYTIKPRNVETLKKFASVEDKGGKFGGSTPKVKGHPILENTWVGERDLPSPILKNGAARSSYAESADSISTSVSDSAEFSAKTSSPLNISPAISDQAINAIGNDDGGIEAAKENIQGTENVRPKQIKAPTTGLPAGNATKLRRPTNWTGGANKVANGAGSGIPRPASRIPAPKFARSNPK